MFSTIYHIRIVQIYLVSTLLYYLIEALRNSKIFITRVSFVIDHFVYVKMTPIQVHYAAHNTAIGLVDK